MQVCIILGEHRLMSVHRKPCFFLRAAKRDYLQLPESVQDDAGHNLDRVQQGLSPQCSFSHLRGVGSGVRELRIPDDTDTYRVIYVATFPNAVYVLDAFQKKSPTGRSFPKHIQDRIAKRYREAERHSANAMNS